MARSPTPKASSTVGEELRPQATTARVAWSKIGINHALPLPPAKTTIPQRGLGLGFRTVRLRESRESLSNRRIPLEFITTPRRCKLPVYPAVLCSRNTASRRALALDSSPRYALRA